MSNDVTRREFLTGAVAVAAAGTAGGLLAPTAAEAAPLPSPADSGIDHIVVVMTENRSFDHYLGWLPGADGRRAGLTYTDNAGVAHQTHHLTVPYGCGFNDPDHSYEGGCRAEQRRLRRLAARRQQRRLLHRVLPAEGSRVLRARRGRLDRVRPVLRGHDGTDDEWGGFFDHVVPPVGEDPNPDLGARLRGFRVPCTVISPRARRGTSTTVFTTTRRCLK